MMSTFERLPSLSVEATSQDWPLSRPFRISRGSKSVARTVLASVRGEGPGGLIEGRGEAVPDPRYGETVENAVQAILETSHVLSAGVNANEVDTFLPRSAARSALDCALWDWRAKAAGKSVWSLAGLQPPEPTVTAFTISLDTAEKMAEQARLHAGLPLLKIKLGDPADDAARLVAVRDAAPDARLIVDANEGWTSECLAQLCRCAAELGVEMIEQPLPAGADSALSDIETFLPVCADESFAGDVGLAELAARYQAVNIKLEKAGGFSGAVQAAREAQAFGLDILIGSFVGTSLGAAQALPLAHAARWVDLDGPLYLKDDRQPALSIENGVISVPPRGLWGCH